MPFATTTASFGGGIGYWITVLIVGAILAGFLSAMTNSR